MHDYLLTLDAQASETLVTDAIPERVRKMGNTTLGSIGDSFHCKPVNDNGAAFVGAAGMLTGHLCDNLVLIDTFQRVTIWRNSRATTIRAASSPNGLTRLRSAR